MNQLIFAKVITNAMTKTGIWSFEKGPLIADHFSTPLIPYKVHKSSEIQEKWKYKLHQVYLLKPFPLTFPSGSIWTGKSLS